MGVTRWFSSRVLQPGCVAAAKVSGPVIHQLAPPLEQVAAEIRALDSCDHVRERGLGQLPAACPFRRTNP